MTKPSLFGRTPGSIIGSWSNLCVTVVRDRLTMTDVELVKPIYASFAEKCDGGFVSAIIVEPGVGVPTDEARKAIPMMRTAYEHRILAMTGILEATGFRMATLRSAMTVMWTIARKAYPRKIAANVHEIVPWLAQFVFPISTCQAVGTAIGKIREL